MQAIAPGKSADPHDGHVVGVVVVVGGKETDNEPGGREAGGADGDGGMLGGLLAGPSLAGTFGAEGVAGIAGIVAGAAGPLRRGGTMNGF